MHALLGTRCRVRRYVCLCVRAPYVCVCVCVARTSAGEVLEEVRRLRGYISLSLSLSLSVYIYINVCMHIILKALLLKPL